MSAPAPSRFSNICSTISFRAGVHTRCALAPCPPHHRTAGSHKGVYALPLDLRPAAFVRAHAEDAERDCNRAEGDYDGEANEPHWESVAVAVGKFEAAEHRSRAHREHYAPRADVRHDMKDGVQCQFRLAIPFWPG